MGNWLNVQKNTKFGGAWVAQSVKCWTPDFCSDQDIWVMRWSSKLGSALSYESA